MGVTEPYEFTWLGDIHGPKPFEFIGFRATIISNTPLFYDKADKNKIAEQLRKFAVCDP